MNTAEDLGSDWQMQLYLQEQEERTTDTLRKIHRHMVLSGKLDKEQFEELVYLTGIKFN